MGAGSGRRRRVVVCCSMDATETMCTRIAACRCIRAVARLRPDRLRSWRVEAETRFSQSRVFDLGETQRADGFYAAFWARRRHETLWLFCPVVVLIHLLSR